MPDGVKAFLERWFVTTLGVLAAAGVVSGVQADGAVPLLAASLLLGILNAILRPILMIAALPPLDKHIGSASINRFSDPSSSLTPIRNA